MRIPAGRFRTFLAATCLLFTTSSLVAGPRGPKNEKLADANDYLEAVSHAKELSIDEQIELWRRFLDEHPSSSFRDEIETNMKRLDELLTKTDPVRKREQKDSDRYLRAVEFSKKLAPEDQIDLWEQYLEENPGSIYRKEVVQRLEGLRAKQEKRGPSAPTVKPEKRMEPDSAPIAPRLPFKDSQKAILLATFPGLLVPGMGHWYTEDYAIAGILTGCRVGGLAVGIPGIVQGNQTMIIAGAVIAGFTYLVDVADAPFSVGRYNEELEKKSKAPSSYWAPESSPGAELSVSFSF